MNWESNEFWVDGGCFRNGQVNPHGYGSISDGTVIETIDFFDIVTNNEAEYNTLMCFFARIWLYGPANPTCTVYLDSRLLVNQSLGRWKVRAKNLQRLNTRVKEYLSSMPEIELKWVPRKEIVKRLGH